MTGTRVTLYKQIRTGTLHSSPRCSVRRGNHFRNIPAKLTHGTISEMLTSGNWKLCGRCCNYCAPDENCAEHVA